MDDDDDDDWWPIKTIELDLVSVVGHCGAREHGSDSIVYFTDGFSCVTSVDTSYHGRMQIYQYSGHDI